MAVTVPTSAPLSVHPLSGRALLAGLLLLIFFPSGSLLPPCATKLLKSVFVDSAVKCINFPVPLSCSFGIQGDGKKKKPKVFSGTPPRMWTDQRVEPWSPLQKIFSSVAESWSYFGTFARAHCTAASLHTVCTFGSRSIAYIYSLRSNLARRRLALSESGSGSAGGMK